MGAKGDQCGQALFELVVFLPFMVFLLQLIVIFGSSINGGINQQKVLRGFYYQYIRNSSFIVPKEVFEEIGKGNIGFVALTWAKEQRGDVVVAPCYEVMRLFGAPTGETCDLPAAQPGANSFIRLFSYYGICGPNYVLGPGGFSDSVVGQNFVAGCAVAD